MKIFPSGKTLFDYEVYLILVNGTENSETIKLPRAKSAMKACDEIDIESPEVRSCSPIYSIPSSILILSYQYSLDSKLQCSAPNHPFIFKQRSIHIMIFQLLFCDCKCGCLYIFILWEMLETIVEYKKPPYSCQGLDFESSSCRILTQEI